MSWMMGKLVLAGVIAAGFVNPGLAQTTIQGKVVDSSAAPVGGVNVALYVPGRQGAIQSVKTDPNSGVYKFDKPSLADAFDIVYTKSSV